MFILSLAGLVLGGIAAAGAFGGYRINTTPSVPLGLWQIETLSRDVRAGDNVFICPPADAPEIKLARDRLYLPAGLCEGNMAPLIKTVVAAPKHSWSSSMRHFYSQVSVRLRLIVL